MALADPCSAASKEAAKPLVDAGWPIPEVRQAERLFGDPDYLVRVATTDLEAYQALRDERLATLPGVRRLTSTIVMKRVVDERPFLAEPDSI